MIYQSIVMIAVVATTTVIPAPSRPRTKRLSRGPAWTDFRELALDSETIGEAKRSVDKRKRIAVLGRPNGVASAEVAAELVRPGLRYSQRLIVVDATTTETLFASAKSAADLRETAQKHGVDLVLVVNVDAELKQASMTVYPSNEDTVTIGRAALEDLEGSVIRYAVRARKTFLGNREMMPANNAEQLDRQPKADFAAMTHHIAARRKLAGVIKTEDAVQRLEICREAMASADRAIAESQNFLEAYLIKASCQDELDQKVELQQTLRMAWGKKDPPEHDLLTLLELQGDYARFVQSDIDTAYGAYTQLLGVDPTNLTGLWAMIDILLTPDENTDPDPEEAAKYAATLVACHPHSGVARAILSQQNE